MSDSTPSDSKNKDIAYVSEVKIVRQKGPHRKAWLPAETEPVDFGVHGAIAEHYGVSEDVAARIAPC